MGKVDHRESFAKLPMVQEALVYDTVFPSPGRRPTHHTLRPVAFKIEGPIGALFFTLIAEEWNISKADGEPADFGHDMGEASGKLKNMGSTGPY